MTTILLASAVAPWIPIVALVVSVATFLFSQRELGRRSKVDYVAALEKRVGDCENDRTGLKTEMRQLRDENLDMMRRLVRLENGAR